MDVAETNLCALFSQCERKIVFLGQDCCKFTKAMCSGTERPYPTTRRKDALA